MIKREELTNPNSCMSRAKDDELVFVLLGRDAATPHGIRAWAAERIRLGKNKPDDPQILSALADAQSLDGLTDFRSPAPTPPLDVEGWKRPEDGLPDDDSDVLAAIWWEHVANPEESSYSIHDCAYYEGGEGSGQKIFTDCEGEEFEAKEVAFWIYKKDLAASLLRRHIASPAQPEKR